MDPVRPMGLVPWLFLLIGVLAVILVVTVWADTTPPTPCPECRELPPPPEPRIEHVKVPVSVFVRVNRPTFVPPSTVDTYNARISQEARVTEVTSDVIPEESTELSQIPMIIYINMASSKQRNADMQAEIRRWGIKARVFRFDGIGHQNRALGCFMSHVHCVAWAANQKQNVLILEDDFVLDVSRDTLAKYLDSADSLLSGRWDVLQLAQYVHMWQPLNPGAVYPVFRLLHSTTASGYLVNRHYAKDFFTKWSRDLEARVNMEAFETEDWNDQTQIVYQKEDTWLGFDQSMGSQRAGHSVIGGGFAHNVWRCNPTYNKWYSSDGLEHDLVLVPPPSKIFKIAIVLEAKYADRINLLRRNAFKHHLLEFHVYGVSGVSNPDDHDMDVRYHNDKNMDLKDFDKVFFIDETLPDDFGLLRGGDVTGQRQ